MNADITTRLESIKEIVQISRERNVEVRDKAEDNINSLRLISESILKLEAELLEDGVIE